MLRQKRHDNHNSAGEAMRVLALVASILSVVVGSASAIAADYPTRPVRMIVGFAPGGPTDILARLLAQYVSQKLGQQFIVENRPGGVGNTATEFVTKSDPDGYTLLVVTTSNAINTTFYKKLPYNFMEDIVPVAGLGRVAYVMAVPPALPVKTAGEFIAFAKANPAQVNYASSGVGTSNHITGEMLKAATGANIVHVPYRGNAAAYPDLISGRIQLLFADPASALPHIRSGAIKGLAVTSPKPLDTVPDLPPLAATIPGFEATAWYGIGAPKGTPPEIVATINREINAGLNDPAIRQKYREMETEPLAFSPAEYAAFMRAEAKRWGDAVDAAGIKAD
ncbi:MAG TPA: tripartite tricarboxylate transporter substrate binding protein [Xanthobacteraceae bacterium]|nr:tripartite tricarboxylate transporter substrate binding protein [Xanthobacteraceae bacterium]